MQTLEKPKDSLLVLRFNTDSIVANGEYPISVLPFGRNMHDRRPFGSPIFYSIADKILEQLVQVRAVHSY